MAFILRFVEASLDDFVLFADESPLWAVVIIYLVLALLFSNIWATKITHLQQLMLPGLRYQVGSTSPGSEFFNTGTSCFNAGYTFDIEIPYIEVPYNMPKFDARASNAVQADSSGFKKPLKDTSVTATHPPPSKLGISNTRPKSKGDGFFSIASQVSNRSHHNQYAPIGLPMERPNISNSGNRNGGTVVSPPVQNRTYVSFYASSSPSHRGELHSPTSELMCGTWLQILSN